MIKVFLVIFLLPLCVASFAQSDSKIDSTLIPVVDSLSNIYGKMDRLLYISVEEQKMFFFEGKEVKKTYLVSTSANGSEYGAVSHSSKTPLGMHIIKDKIGDNAPIGEIFIKKKDTKKISKIYTEKGSYPADINDDILTRLLALAGLEKGFNKGINEKGEVIDTFYRGIYIHGTNNEADIGSPLSHGCVRMINTEIAELYDLVKEGDFVFIK